MKNLNFKTLIILFSFLFISSSVIVVIDRKITKEDKQLLIVTWFNSPYEYMFDKYIDCEKPNKLNYFMDNNIQFMAGIKGLMSYGGLNGSIDKVFGLSNDHFSYKSIEQLSGINCFTKTKENNGTFFNYLNPEIIDWGYENLLPSPKLKVNGYSCKEIYQTVFSRFFRMMTEAYIYANIDNDIETLKKEYIKKFYTRDYYGLTKIETEYADALPSYKIDRDGTRMTPAMAVAFWIRRDIDGSSTKLWNTLQKFMKKYDKKWLKKL